MLCRWVISPLWASTLNFYSTQFKRSYIFNSASLSLHTHKRDPSGCCAEIHRVRAQTNKAVHMLNPCCSQLIPRGDWWNGNFSYGFWMPFLTANMLGNHAGLILSSSTNWLRTYQVKRFKMALQCQYRYTNTIDADLTWCIIPTVVQYADKRELYSAVKWRESYKQLYTDYASVTSLCCYSSKHGLGK